MKALKTILFVFLFLLLWFPMFQEFTKQFKEVELTGAFTKPEKPTFNLQEIKSLAFQKKWEDYENSNFGFRGLFVKLRNSINNVLFGDLSVADNIEGKDGFIFSLGSVESTLGINHLKKEKIDSTIDKIKFLKEGIEKHGGQLLVVIAPSKETIMPDFLPYRYKGKQKKPTNYTNFIEGYKKAGIEVIDFCPYFKKLRDTCKYDLFTKTGFHWSMYGAAFAQDSLVHYIEKHTVKPIPTYKKTGIEIDSKARDSDNDFENSLNLFFSVGQSQYAYPKFKIISSRAKNYRPKVIVIADSYFWQLKNQKMLGKVFSEDSKFWFYFATTSYSMGDGKPVPLEKTQTLMKELESADYVILFSNISTLPTFPYGVTDFYFKGGKIKTELTNSLSSIIKSKTTWVDSLTQQAKIKNTLVDDEIGLEVDQILNTKKSIQLKAANNKFLCAGDESEGVILANRDDASSWETFYILNLKNNQVAIQSYKQKVLSAEINTKTEITNTRLSISNWEIFTIINLPDNYVAFKACNGKYLSLDKKTNQIFANANVIGVNEKFKLNSIIK